ncbi:MAG: 1-acyl-sn-glycerol-3-phosphate acyltransferase [Anaerolineales bacterium]|jgi:1-acyl-sn-glycerol-3-phosphate acyltransferase|nr:1-acyl-sn-glycerol-3-phosphate acyltransferase [Anaerolineales bacterium]
MTEPQPEKTPRYQHQHWETRRRILRWLIRNIGFTLLAKLDHVEGLENVPASGPVIVMINHIAFIDSLVTLHVLPRHVVPMAKVEVYNYPLIGIFPRLWGVIPVRREEVDRRAIQGALDVLHAGEMILVAPEATRHTALQQGKVGVAYLAARAGALVLPVAVQNSPGFPAFRLSRRWRGPGVVVKIGRPFRYLPELKRPTQDQLRLMTDEAMYALASMLPETLRGVYADLSKATQSTIEYLDK